MKELDQKRLWSFIGIFLITLVISLPFYSANGLAASLKITKNSGSAGVEGFLDAKGDTWEVEALVSGVDNATALDPNQVKIKINDNERPFGSCSDDALGKICKYTSPLTEGVSEVQYKFQVYYSYINQYGVNASASDESVISSDKTAPKVGNVVASQDEEGTVHLNFDVTDRVEGKPSVGIKSIDIIDADSGSVVQKFDNLNVQDFNYQNDGGTGGILNTTFSGEGYKRIKVSAEDLLGHKTTNAPIATFDSDFVAPVIVTDSLNFTQIGKFRGPVDITTGVTLDVRETTKPSVLISAPGTNLEAEEGECTEDQKADVSGLWHCRWENVVIKGSAPNPLSLEVVVRDEYGNLAQETITHNFVMDNEAPEVAYFGTKRIYEENEYITSSPQRIYLSVREQGSLMNESGIRADLEGLGGGKSQAPDNCTQSSETFDCYWDIDVQAISAGSAHIVLSRFQDNVGNIGKGAGVELIVDNAPPKVTKLEFYGVSDGGEHNYFQSNDQLKIKLYVEESSGVRILVNMNDLVNDAATNLEYLENEKTYGHGDGWVAFDESSCVRGKEDQGKGGRWECTAETAPLKSGPERNNPLQIVVTDTAGNEAFEYETPKHVEEASGAGKYKFELLGKSEEDKPDYWSIAKGYPKQMMDFVDLDTTKVAYTRMPVELRLSSSNPQASVLSVELIPDSCKVNGTSPEVSRALAYGGNYPQGDNYPTLTLVLEFSPFDGRTFFSTSSNKNFESAEASYTCKVKIYSKVGKNALSVAETQEIPVKVKFGFSALGAVDENLADLIKSVKGTDFMKFANALHYINVAIQWIKYILKAVMVIVTIVEIYDLLSVLLNETGTVVGKTGAGKGWEGLIKGECSLMEGVGKTEILEYVKYIQIPEQILSCVPNSGEYYSLNWYDKYQQAVLQYYNLITGRGSGALWEVSKDEKTGETTNLGVVGLGTPATSLYDNIYLSIIGLCVPGVVYNMEKLREIYCRKIICYGSEVPQGVATIESCNDLYDLMKCEYWTGPAMDFIPFLGALSQIGKMIKGMFTSPVGLISITEVAVCAATCWSESSSLLKACNWIKAFTKLLDIVESVVGLVKQPPTVSTSPYCDMADDIDVEKLTGGKNYGTESSAPATEEPAAETSGGTNPYQYTEAPSSGGVTA
jgi:hypothetical protein